MTTENKLHGWRRNKKYIPVYVVENKVLSICTGMRLC